MSSSARILLFNFPCHGLQQSVAGAGWHCAGPAMASRRGAMLAIAASLPPSAKYVVCPISNTPYQGPALFTCTIPSVPYQISMISKC